jgi:hypothetical protein
MSFKAWSICASLLCAASSPLAAAPATEEGAKALLKQFTEIYGPFFVDRKILTLEPKGDEYLMSFDIEKIVGLLKISELHVKATPFTALLSPLPEGGWSYRGNDYPAVTFEVPTPTGQFSGTIQMKGYSNTGVFTPSKPEILRGMGRIDAIEGHMHMADATPNGSDIDILEAGIVIETNADWASDSTVNVSVKQSIKRVGEIVTVMPVDPKGKPLGEPVKVTYDIGETTAVSSLEGLRAPAIGKIRAWAMAHLDDWRAEAGRAELRGLITAALPLWDALGGTAEIANLKFSLPQGSAQVKSIKQGISISGLAPAGHFRLAFDFDGISVDSSLLPAWSAALQPASFAMDVKITMNNVDKILHAVIDDKDFLANTPSPWTQSLVAALALDGEPRIVLAPGRFTNPLIDIGYEGAFDLAPVPPHGQLTITANDLDATKGFLQKNAATVPAMAQAVPFVDFVEGLARPGESGKLAWVLEFPGDKSVIVNGRAFPMGK